MKTKLLLFFALFAMMFTRTSATEQLWVGQTYQCFMEDYANRSLSWLNISWSVDYGLYQNYSGSYVRTVSFEEYKSGTYNVKVNWTETDMSDSFAPFYHKSHTWSFTCKDNPLVLSPTSASISVGETKQLSCSFTYNNSYTKGITYSSSNTSVATVSSSGLVTAKGVGTAKITAKSASSKDEETCTITVTSPEIKVTSISLNKTSLSMQTGEYETLKATVKPDNATDKSVTWSSSNNSVATVNTTGKVAAISAGSATITCKANDGSGKQATCTITVTDAEVKVTNITLNKTSLSLQTGEYETLTATVKPDNATDKSVKWSSDKTSVATIDNYGKVTAKSEGTATITCTANDGSGVSASCSITVTDPEPESADIWFVSVTCDNADPNNLTQNDKLQMHATFMNKGATAEIYTMLALIDTKESKIVAHGDFDHRDFKGGEQTTVAYEYALDTIPAGNYEATVLYFDWNDEMWIYGGEDFLYNITVKESGRKGDLTGDGEVNGTDLVALTNMILGKSTKTATADVNGDGEVNGTDYVALVNIILGRASARKAEDSTPRNGINILNIKKIIKK